MKWVTRKHVMVERTACPWLIRKFIDPEPEFIFVDTDQIQKVAEKENAIPFDAPNVELGHHGDKLTMEAFIQKYDLKDPDLLELEKIFHGAPEGRGVAAVIRGISFGSKDDYEAIEKGSIVWEGLYTQHKQKRLQEKHKSELDKLENWQQKIEFLKTKLTKE